jgi:hypothetical protein
VRGDTRFVLAIAVMAGSLAAPVAIAGGCAGGYHVAGVILDGGGRPVPGARVWVLMDKVTQDSGVTRGIRARSFSADAGGVYEAHIVCGGSPNPCAKKPKHVTIAASGDGFGLRLVVHPLKNLPLIERGGACFIEAPPLTLSRSLG